MFDDLFRSKNLIYRAFENHVEEKTFIHRLMMDDPTTYAQSTNRLLRPLNLEDLSKSTPGDALLAVVICLPKETAETESTSIGWLSLDAHPAARHHRSCILGITIAKGYQGKGYGTEAITWAVEWAFRVAGVHAIRLTCFSFNERALRVYERIGFVREGINREAYYYNRTWHDRVLLSMLESDWLALKKI